MNETNLATRTKNDLFKYLKSALNYGTKWHDFNFAPIYNKMEKFQNIYILIYHNYDSS